MAGSAIGWSTASRPGRSSTMIDEAVAPTIEQPAAPPPTPTPTVVRRYVRFRGGEGRAVEEPVIAEMRLRIEVDGESLVELMCSPHRVNALVLGFLYHEGMIDALD